jgi:outer membrane protein OmpA-like peptidoglycan-associated protein
MTKLKSTLILLSALSIFSVSCTSPGKRTAIGAGAGAATGAALGALFGSQSGNAGKGALVGAALGASLGGFIGNRLDKQAKELEKLAEVRRTEQGLVAKLKSDLLFDTNSSDIKTGIGTNVEQIAQILRKYPENNITVLGHTDADGSDSYNQALSQKRAQAVATKLVSNGVPGQYVISQGVGEAQPVADNKSPAGKARNRRVELVITVEPSRVPKG